MDSRIRSGLEGAEGEGTGGRGKGRWGGGVGSGSLDGRTDKTRNTDWQTPFETKSHLLTMVSELLRLPAGRSRCLRNPPPPSPPKTYLQTTLMWWLWPWPPGDGISGDALDWALDAEGGQADFDLLKPIWWVRVASFLKGSLLPLHFLVMILG